MDETITAAVDQGIKNTINNTPLLLDGLSQTRHTNYHMSPSDTLSFIPLGGIGDVTKNMFVYEYKGQILIVDCGLGFADETMLGVDLLLPDITYLKQAVSQGKRIVGMLITHGHEDHMGGLPFILPQLPEFPVFATEFSAAMANRKLKEFGLVKEIQIAEFGLEKEIKIGPFAASFIRVTHSVPDTAHILIKTPIGNFYHGSDYKFDDQPFDGKATDFQSIQKTGELGILALMTDSLGAERSGTTPSEYGMEQHFLDIFKKATGKVFVTTYSSHINRINQILWATEKAGKKICFVGRSLIHAVETGKAAKRIIMPKDLEVPLEGLKFVKPNNLVLLVAGSQGQENSALTRIVNGTKREIQLEKNDIVIFSSDTIPGNEVLVNTLIDAIAKKGSTVLYSNITHDFHVSGHGSQEEMIKLLSLTKPRFAVPISSNFRHMSAYKRLAEGQGIKSQQILLGEDGLEFIFSKDTMKLGKRFPARTIYVDEISGEEIEDYVLMDRQKLSTEGVVIIMAEIDGQTKQLLQDPDIIARGFSAADSNALRRVIGRPIKNAMQKNPSRIANTVVTRKLIRDVAEREIAQKLKRKPLIMPVVIEI